MKAGSAPLRFPLLVVGAWVCGRIAMILPGLGTPSGVVSVALAGVLAVPLAMESREATALPAPAANITVALDEPAPGPRHEGVTLALDEPSPVPVSVTEWHFASRDLAPVPPLVPQPEIAVLPPSRAPASRWSGYGWIFVRGDGGRPSLASGGQLGGSQAGVRLAYRIAELGPGSLALAGRVSTPLRESSGAEAAIGIDWKPVARLPLRLSIERRIAIGAEGRNAWSAYAAGGFYRSGLPGGTELDGYAQAGVVGARSGDLFADGALRIGRPIELPAGKRLVVGAGAWGAVQPGAARLDIGPRAALSLPLGGTTVTGAAEWRIRVAGDARPGSGAALSLAADF
jgi:hypothetical protein